MYAALLTNRYLTSRVIPLIAVAAVGLCVALVIIVVSVMSGFLDLVRASGKTLMGDVVIASPGRGIPHYDRLLRALESLPDVAAATPLVESFGMVRLPYEHTEPVQLWGVEPLSFAKVTGYSATLQWKRVTPAQAEALPPDSPYVKNADQILVDALTLTDSRTERPGIVLGVYVGVGNVRQKDGTYRPTPGPFGPWTWWMPLHQVTLSTFPTDVGLDRTMTESVILPVVNEFSSGVFLIDDRRVIVPIEVAQRLLHLNEQKVTSELEVDAEGLPKVIGIDPPRATQVLVRAVDGVTPEKLAGAVEDCYQRFWDGLIADDSVLAKPPALGMGASVKTWEQQQAGFLDPIEKERELMRTLFSIVYLVCAGLVLAIFWAIVHEKTRDIGILRSVGASREGVLWIFTRYGLVIGVVGSIAGCVGAWLVVRDINPIHDALGSPPLTLAVLSLAPCVLALAWIVIRGGWQGLAWLAMTLGVLAVGGAIVGFGLNAVSPELLMAAARAWEYALGLSIAMILACFFLFGRLIRPAGLIATLVGCLVFVMFLGVSVAIVLAHRYGGFVMWNPEVYLFTKIPNELDWRSAWGTMFLAVTFSVLGAAIAAAKAADTDPVQALRYE